MSYAERAMERLYENEGLTDELTDTEAKPLLKWAESEILRLDALGLDEETFDAQFKLVRRNMKRINSFVAKRQNADDEKRQTMIDRFIDGLKELGHPIDTVKVETFVNAQNTWDNLATVQGMLAFILAETAHTDDTPTATEAVDDLDTVETPPNENTPSDLGADI